MYMPSKEYRQRLIEELVEKEFISTQAEIAEHLARRGIKVTQATISRDVNELRLVRLPAGPGQHRYRSTPLAAEVETAKCNVCHKGKSKKDRNVYGEALAKLLDKKEDKDNKDKIRQALETVAKESSNPADASAPTFGGLIEQGKLPGGPVE